MQALLIAPVFMLLFSDEIAAKNILDRAKRITLETTTQLLSPKERQKLGIEEDIAIITKRVEENETPPQLINDDWEFTLNFIISVLNINDRKKKTLLEAIAIPQVLYEQKDNLLLEKLDKEIPGLSIKRVDERFTSKMAFQTMIDSGLSKKQRKNKALIDEISATIILQDYLYTDKENRK